MGVQQIKPAYNGNKQCIVFSANADYIPLTAVAIQSIIETSQKSNIYDIIILHKNMADFPQYAVCKMVEDIDNISIRFCNIAEVISGDKMYTSNRKTLSEEAYYRLYIPWILSEEYEKALYIDGDMILRGDIAQIFDTELGENLIAAVRDYWGICNCYIPGDHRKEYRLSIGLDDLDNYVISGTLLFNLKLFRTRFVLADVKKCINQYEWEQHDQDVINILCQGAIHYLSPTWGLMSDYGNNHYLPQYLQQELADVGNDPIIVHFGGSRKPNTYPYADFDGEFWKYADHSPYLSVLLNQVKSTEYRCYVVRNLLQKEFAEAYTANGIERFYKGVSLGAITSARTRYRVVKVKNNTLHLEGMLAFFGVSLDSNIRIYADVNGLRYCANEQTKEDGFNHKKGVTTYRGEAFIFEVPLDPQIGTYTVELVAELNGILFQKKNLSFEKFAPLGRTYRKCYYHCDNWIVTTNYQELHIETASRQKLLSREIAFCKELWKKKRYTPIICRILYHMLKKFVRKPIWLISDRLSRADDNGEAFFKFLQENKKDQVLAYFVMDKKCSDFKRMKKYGTVVPAYSYRHKILHLLAECSISSQTDDIFRNPFGRSCECYRDILAETKFVFLQHGIITNDLRDWLHNRCQQITGFVTSTKREYEEIVYGGYGYTEEKVWLTGLARFDRLNDSSNKTVTILPTWRMYLTTHQNTTTGVWGLKNGFSDSNYAAFYRNLMHHSRLRKRAEELGYTIQFKVHPSFMTHENEFMFDSDVRIVDHEISYRELFATSSLIVTDYSSVVNDFVYLRKPVLYLHFDYDEFFSGDHIYTKGNINYERDGFGEVEYNLESAVDRIIEYMENDCKLKDIYRTRIDNFFAFNDRNNCARIFDKIMELNEHD